uniref:Uncharacterized protein n=1 Tax=Salmonella sp. 96A-29192 TaxID=1179814 RepID=I3VZS1_9ENTR|nr:hypothetical protein [Salmonella sp. 96A-29192]
MNGLKSWLKNRWCCFNALAGVGTTKTIDVRVAAVTGNVRAISGVPALYGANG